MIAPSGGPAFPVYPRIHPDGSVMQVADATGMTLRQWYAGQALLSIGAMIAGGQHKFVDCGRLTPAQSLARDAFELADAMIAHEGKE